MLKILILILLFKKMKTISVVYNKKIFFFNIFIFINAFWLTFLFNISLLNVNYFYENKSLY